MHFNLRILFNFISYVFFLFLNKVFEITKFNQKNFYKKLEYSTFYSYKKKNWILNLIFNLKVNLLRFERVKNYEISKNFFNEKYFFSTRSNFLKKNKCYKNKKLKNYIKILPLIKKSNYVIHLGSSTSFQNLMFSNHFKKKIFFQTDKSNKITIMNSRLFSNNHRIKVKKIDILDIPGLIKKYKFSKILIYSETSMMYLPKEEVKNFLKKISKFTNVIVVFAEPGSNKNYSIINFKNALIFEHNYLNLFKSTNFHYQKLFSKNNLFVAKNY